ncbi:MAG: hypothetical protein S4CHLAM81_13090 [Chlamydiales bacterium]|nr:hypothetical protein [Chlamydiales bacterium]MCH9636081.1 hypothetical protein [Chlamydiales bacterium]MCH9704478.1 hypothetical protein [Chlamydiota bacterium]
MISSATYQNFRHHARIATTTTTLAVVAVVIPLLVITASLPTLHLGVKLADLHVVLIPSAIVLAGSLPLMLIAIRANRARNRVFKPFMGDLKAKVRKLHLPQKLPKKPTPAQKKAHRAQMKTFRKTLLKQILSKESSVDFRYFLLSELAKSYPKKSRWREAIEEVRASSVQ